jgi:hypothetical protein
LARLHKHFAWVMFSLLHKCGLRCSWG